MAEKFTPGVYVEESSSFPPSVVGVATAIPAFIGYTKSSPQPVEPVLISSLLDFQKIFGAGKEYTWENNALVGQDYVMYDSIRLFFDNGGGDCYVVSIGDYNVTPSADAYKNAIKKLEEIDDVTILLFPDAATLLNAASLASVQTEALDHCATVGGRFAILDLPLSYQEGENTITDYKQVITKFRDGIGVNNLRYGAAYFPYLKTTYTKDIPVKIVLEAMNAESAQANSPEKEAYDLLSSDDKEKDLKIAALIPEIKDYASKLRELQDTASIIPPSGAIAGLYAATDNRVGVWQAPANISVSSVCGLTQLLSDSQQGNLNKPSNGKSINAIRYFKGKGFLVWGCRTLLGNDNEWKYVNVRRFFSFVEQSLKNSTAWAVFQPNDANTWIKIQSQIESFLTTLWRAGALAGATPDKAFFVQVGLGKTMDSQDILDGLLKVRIGLAAVRPAEFIVLEFSHKIQE